MNENEEMQEIRGFFIEEAEELFENINKILLEAEQNGELSDDEIASLFRDVHTLKGGSGSVELDFFAKYIHYLENFIDSLRKGEFKPTMEMVDFLMIEQDILVDMIAEEAQESLNENEFNEKLEVLLKKIEVFSSDDSKKIRILENNFDIEKYSVEFVDMNTTLLKTLTTVDDEEFDDEYVDEIFRQLHTLKGNSSFLNLVYYPQYLHDLETLLDRARNKEIIYTNKLNESIIKIIKDGEEIAYQEFTDSFELDNFKDKLNSVIELLKDISDSTITDKGFEILDAPTVEDQGFELFNFDKTEENKELGFEIFDKPKESPPAFEIFDKPKENPSAFEIFDKPKENSPAFEIFDKPKQKIEKKQSNKKKEKTSKKQIANSSIRVGLEKIDFLMNRVGDLVITKSMLYKFLQDLSQKIDDPSIVDNLSRLDREIRELQEAVMSVRMIPMESVYAKLPKTIRDLAKKLEKKVDFIHIGDSVEIDKLMVEGLSDPLTHIIRNSLDHGIETPSQRIAKGKKETGKITISAAQESGHIIIAIEDDGAGINIDRVLQKALDNGVVTEKEASLMSNDDKAMLIFAAGLSTAEAVSDVSGRGVGMDVVMTNISSLGGSISIKTVKDKGSKITILLPLTLAILDGLNVKIGEQQLIMPLNMIVESLQPNKEMIKKIGDNQKEILMLRNEFIPIIRLHKFFNIEPTFTEIDKGMLIVTRVANMKAAMFIDDFLNQEQIVVKSLEKNYKKINGIGAATIRGDGSIGLILDVMNIIEKRRR